MSHPYQSKRLQKIGIFGGGQLGYMLAEAARKQGLFTVVYCQSMVEPAVGIADEVVIGGWTDREALHTFATSGIKWLVGEFENADPDSVDYIGSLGVLTYTMAKVLRWGRDRLLEKQLAQSLNIPTVTFAPYSNMEEGKADEKIAQGTDFAGRIILKTRRMGYDGKGQQSFPSLDALDDQVLSSLPKNDYLIEERIVFDYECSVHVTRTNEGEIVVSPAVRNRHTNIHGGGILEYSWWSKDAVAREVETQAQDYAVRIAKKLKVVGVVTVEFFVTKDGKVIFNELAPRVHNSFHGSREASQGNQFDLHIAAVVGLPLVPIVFERPWIMVNLISEQIFKAHDLRRLGFEVTDYRKADCGKARKMGHSTLVVISNYRLAEAMELLQELGLIEQIP